MFLTHGIILSNFQLKNKQGKMYFFQELFLVANTTIEIELRIPVLAFNKVEKVEINFAD